MAVARAIEIPTEEAKKSKAIAAIAGAALCRRFDHQGQGHARATPVVAQAEQMAAQLDRTSTRIVCRKGQTLVQEGDRAEHVYRIVSGAFRAVRLLADGRRCVTDFYMPGDFLGLADDKSYGHSIEALADASLLCCTRASFEATLDRDPTAARHFFCMMRSQVSATRERLLLLGRMTAAERLANFLLTLADHKTRDGHTCRCTIELPMNRSDMADYLGLRIETVCRLLAVFKHRRIIDLGGIHSVTVLRRDLLEAECEGNV